MHIVAVVGPTASGKSDLGLDLAQALDGEIVSADAFQFYRGMDIGTAKVAPQERRGIPHHQIDTLDVTQDATVAAYQASARADIAAIRSRGRRPIVVGGSGLYVRALLDAIEFPPTDPGVRARLEARLAAEGPGVLAVELRRLDPAAADLIDPRNSRRLIRALEAIELTGRPYSATLPAERYAEPTLQIGIQWPRPVLAARIDARTAAMVDAGLFDEVAALRDAGLRRGSTAARAVGYAESLDFLDGLASRADTVELIARNTRRLVRRQLQWFARDSRVTWLAPGDVTGAIRLVT